MLNRILRIIKKRRNLQTLILMYHRIDKEGMDPWGLCVTPEHFGEQLEIIQKYANPISLGTLINNLKNNRVIPFSVVVTFDDGYANNLFLAKPLLEKYNIPATFYITAGMINGNREYWWDELEQILLKPGVLPNELILEITGIQHQWILGKATNYTEMEYKKDFHLKPWESQEGTRLHFYYSVWQCLQPLFDEERLKLIHNIAQWADTSPLLRESHCPLRENELQELSNNELVEIGAHTIKHPSLPTQSKTQQMLEINCSKRSLENIVEHPVVTFAYPHGEYSKETIEILQSAGFQSACTTDETALGLKQNFFELPRFQVEDWDGDTLLKMLHHRMGN